MSNNRSLPADPSYVAGILESFDIPSAQAIAVLKKLEADKTITLTACLDEVLIPLSDSLHSKRDDTDIKKFRKFLSLCFTGELSQKAWDTMWSHLSEEEQIFYSTIDYYAGNPLGLAIKAGNQDALERLKKIYRDLLPRYPAQRVFMLQHLKKALLNINSALPAKQQIEIQLLLLEICQQQATPIGSVLSDAAFANKQINWGVVEVLTPLLEVFAELCKEYFSQKHPLAVKTLTDYLHVKLTDEEFSKFKDKVLVLLGTSYPKISDWQPCWRALEDQRDLAFRNLLKAIEQMRGYGETLQKEGSTKGLLAISLATKLKSKAEEFFIREHTADELASFKQTFAVELNSKNKEMSEYRTSWPTIIKNILAALTGIGALLLLGKVAYSLATQNRALCFFQKNKTTSEEKIEAVNRSLATLTMTA